jgi:hypothetical protein
MSTSTDTTIQGAPTGPASDGQTSVPEQQHADLARPQTDEQQPAGDQSQGAEGGEKLTPEQKTIRKLERRIANLTARNGGSAREAELARTEVQQLRERLQQLEGGRETQGDDRAAQRQPQALSQAEIDRIANERARDMVRSSSIANSLKKTFEAGAKLDGFREAMDALGDEVRLVDGERRPTPFLEAVLECDDPARLMHHLGNNPEEAAALNGLSPAQLGRRLAKLEDQLKQDAKGVSKAPTPLNAVKPKASSTPALKELSGDAFIKRRREQIAARGR